MIECQPAKLIIVDGRDIKRPPPRIVSTPTEEAPISLLPGTGTMVVPAGQVDATREDKIWLQTMWWKLGMSSIECFNGTTFIIGMDITGRPLTVTQLTKAGVLVDGKERLVLWALDSKLAPEMLAKLLGCSLELVSVDRRCTRPPVSPWSGSFIRRKKVTLQNPSMRSAQLMIK